LRISRFMLVCSIFFVLLLFACLVFLASSEPEVSGNHNSQTVDSHPDVPPIPKKLITPLSRWKAFCATILEFPIDGDAIMLRYAASVLLFLALWKILEYVASAH
jgi:hypothetical protein